MDTRPRAIKRLYWDVEASPNVVLAFSAGYKKTINPDSILEERKTICICYKWEGESKVYTLRWDKNHDDRHLLAYFLKVAAEADELVAHFGDEYDVKWFRGRVVGQKLDPTPIYKTVDTCKLASSYFYFNSNKLDYIAQFFGYGNKIPTDFSLWKGVMQDEPGALDKMCRYCVHDVELLEKVFKRMQPFVKPKTHEGVLNGKDKWTCPRTGSENVVLHKIRTTEKGARQYQMQNLDDGTYFTISSPAFNLYELAMKKKKKKPIRY